MGSFLGNLKKLPEYSRFFFSEKKNVNSNKAKKKIKKISGNLKNVEKRERERKKYGGLQIFI